MCFSVCVRVCGAPLDGWANGGYVLVLWGVGPIRRSGSEI